MYFEFITVVALDCLHTSVKIEPLKFTLINTYIVHLDINI